MGHRAIGTHSDLKTHSPAIWGDLPGIGGGEGPLEALHLRQVGTQRLQPLYTNERDEEITMSLKNAIRALTGLTLATLGTGATLSIL